MNVRIVNCVARGLIVAALPMLMLAAAASRGDAKQDKQAPDIDKIPKAVMEALKSKFPKPVITKWTKETEGNDVIYDIEFKQEGRACEADIKENGTYINYEKAIARKDLPAAVTKAVEARYPKSTFKEIMEITAVKYKKDSLEGYEIVLDTAEKKEVEVTVAPDGKIIEDSGEGTAGVKK